MVTYVALKCISVSIGNRMNALTFLRFTLRVMFSNIRSSVKYLIAQALMQLLISVLYDFKNCERPRV